MPVQHRLHARCACVGASNADASASSSFSTGFRESEVSAGEHGFAGGRPFAFTSSPRQYERDRPFLVDHLAMDLTLDVPKKSVRGSATLTVRRVDPDAETLALDAIGFDIAHVSVDGAEVAYAYDGRVISVPLGKGVARADVRVKYAATPRRGLYFLEPDEHVADRPRQVWSQCQEEDARHWVPCHDKPHVKMTTEIQVRVPNGWFALSNGDLLRKETPDSGAWSFHYKMTEPHPSYLLTLVAGEFAELTAQAGKTPLVYLVPKGREADGERTFRRTPEMIQHFSELLGVPYPWSRYTQVVVSDFIFGGMENTTATTMYEHILLDSRAAIDITSDDLIAHELAHQWFGDFITCRDWSEAWLNEGFATFMEHVWREKHLGRDEYEFAIKGDLETYLSEAHGRYRRPIVCQDYDAPLDLFDRHLYEKGGLVLHGLRAELGAMLFWQGIRDYLTRHARGVVETRDLQRALEAASGKSLGKFFEQAVHKPGHPELEVTVGWDKEVLTVLVKQEQSASDGVPHAFDVVLELDVADAAGTPRRERLKITQRSESFCLPCPKRPLYVVVDPQMRVLGDVKQKLPTDMLRNQLERAKTARGRWLAARALARSDDPTSIASLAARLEDEGEFWGVRVEAAAALGDIRAKECFDVLARATSAKHPKVRRGVMDALGKFRTPAAVEALRPHALKDESYVVEAEAARSLGKTKQPSAFDTLVDVLGRKSWADVLSVGAIDGLAALRDDRAVPHIVARLRYGNPARTRRAAVGALPKLTSDRKGRESLEDLLDDADPMLRLDVARALGELGDAKSRSPLRARLDIDLDPRVRRRLRETLRDLGQHGARGVDHVRDELEKLQGEHADLKVRLGKLEARMGTGSAPNGASKLAVPSKADHKGDAKKKSTGKGKVAP